MTTIPATIQNLKKALKIINNGGLIVYPTDTVYGLGADPFNKKAVKKLFKAKDRPYKEALPVLVSSLKEAHRLAYFPKIADKITDTFWPGPLTIILKRENNIQNFLGGNPNLIGLRMPNHSLTLKLTELCGGSLIGTSANRSGSKPARSAVEAEKQFGKNIDLILDGGHTPTETSSTVIDLSHEKPKIIRTGPITKNQLLKFTE